MTELKLVSVDVYVDVKKKGDLVLNCTPQEAFTMISMPAFTGLISKLVPNYELPEMPKE